MRVGDILPLLNARSMLQLELDAPQRRNGFPGRSRHLPPVRPKTFFFFWVYSAERHTRHPPKLTDWVLQYHTTYPLRFGVNLTVPEKVGKKRGVGKKKRGGHIS
jgi:hypothetical protein